VVSSPGRQLSGAWEVDGVISGWLGCARPESGSRVPSGYVKIAIENDV